MPQYTFQQIAIALNVEIIGNNKKTISHLLTDSRGVVYPSESLFFAIKGVRHDGHRYISDLYQLGVRAFVVEQIPTKGLFPEAGFIFVKSALKTLQKLATLHRINFRNDLIAITGSNGKTIVKEWLFQAIHTDKQTVRSPKSYNSQIGVPLSLWQIDSQHELAIIEAGISEINEMARLETMIRPDIGIITNIGEPHQENFTDYEQKCAEKLLLFRNCKLLIYCIDHTIIYNQLQNPIYSKLKTLSWSFQNKGDIHIKTVSKNKFQTTISGKYTSIEFEYSIPFIDDASIENSIHVVSYLLYAGYSASQIKERMQLLTPVAMRLELKQGINGCTIINDSYNSDLGSLTIALDALVYQNQHGQKTVIMSDILQSGKTSSALYTEVNNLLIQKNISRFIGIGKEIRLNKNIFTINATFFDSTDEFISEFQKNNFINEAILLKGSRSFEFENILKLLEEKEHETVLEINLNAMVHNLNYFRSKLKKETKIIAMVKAFSYGSGTFEIANILQFHRVDYLAVAFADEGVALRKTGITIPIMVMNPEISSFDTIIKHRLEPEIFNFKVLQLFAETAQQLGETEYPIHIKLDTGMHRLGFMENDIDELIRTLKNTPILFVKSIFSHLAGSDEAQFDDFTRNQIASFETFSTKIQQAFSHPIMRHILNSAGIERFPEAQFDMVRLGIGLYGISAINENNVKHVSRLKTIILQIKNIPTNESVGYSRRHIAKKTTKIGIIPIGYADGLHRSLGNGVGKMSVNGKLAPIIGSICMDMCMLDLTDVEANEGDEVVVFGEENTISEVARCMNSIPYEVLTSVSQRVKRVYYQE